MKNNEINLEKELHKVIIEAIKSKKGKEIVSIDLEKIDNSVCDYFIICHGESTTQVGAIVNEIRDKAKESLGIYVDHIEGQQNSNWVLLDYIGIVVHVFLKEQRDFYRLEDLWADGKITHHSNA